MYKNKWESPKNKTSNWCSSIIKIPERIIVGWFLLDCWRANQLFL